MTIKISLLISVLFLNSCLWNKQENRFSGKEYQSIDLRSSLDNPKVPSLLWDKVDEYYKQVHIVDEYSAKLDREKAKVEPPKKVLSVKIRLIDNTGDVFGGRNLVLDFGTSGTALDWKDFLEKDTKGSFFMKFEIQPMPSEDQKKIKVFHLSGSKKLRIDGKVFGGGCDQFRDISTLFDDLNEDGFLVSTIDSRHISLLSGTFVFVAVLGETLYFSSLTMEDSRFPQFQCRR